MNIAIDILKNILLPKLKKDVNFDRITINESFWGTFARGLVNFETDAKPLYAAIYSLELADAEKLIENLDVIYLAFLNAIAEEYVLGHSNKLTDNLIESKNKAFLKDVSFLQSMNSVITKTERQGLKKNLPQAFDRLVFELDEKTLEAVTKKKSREDLRNKFKGWDEELKEESLILTDVKYSLRMPKMEQEYAPPPLNVNQSKSKVISLSWIKYAVAACVVLTAGVLYIKLSTNTVDTLTQPDGNSVVTRENNNELQRNDPENEAIIFPAVKSISRTITILQPASLGFTPSDKKQKITVYLKDATQRIQSLENIIKNNKVGGSVDSKISDKYTAELDDLKKQNNKYVFDGKTLTIFSKYTPEQYTVLSTEDQKYFLEIGDKFYNLKLSSNPLALDQVTEANTIEILEKIHFENE